MPFDLDAGGARGPQSEGGYAATAGHAPKPCLFVGRESPSRRDGAREGVQDSAELLANVGREVGEVLTRSFEIPRDEMASDVFPMGEQQSDADVPYGWRGVSEGGLEGGEVEGDPVPGVVEEASQTLGGRLGAAPKTSGIEGGGLLGWGGAGVHVEPRGGRPRANLATVPHVSLLP